MVIETGRGLDVEIGDKRMEKRRSNGVFAEDVLEERVVGCDPINFGGKGGGGHFVPFLWNDGLRNDGWYPRGRKSRGLFLKKKGPLDDLRTIG